MTYKVLSIKYRPQQFAEVVGQEHVTVTLRNAIQRDRLGPGYIFTGPRGVGKTTTARLLAKALNCENVKDGEPCNTCQHCHEITLGSSLDVQEIDGASNRGIDAIRELREVIKYPPTHSRYRIYIIDEVHMLTKEAFNALLKTLEEPPEHALFIFATTEPYKVPATILSRCQRFDFKRIGTRHIIESLQTICEKEAIKSDPDSLALISNKADGSLRDAESLLDQVVAFAPDGIDLSTVRQVLGIVDIEVYFKVLDAIHNKAAAELLVLMEELQAGGMDIGEFLAGLADHVRALLITRITHNTDLLNLTESGRSGMLSQSQAFGERDLVRMQNLTLETLHQLRQATNQRVAAELLLVKLSKLTRAIELDELLPGPGKAGVREPPPAGKPELKTASPNRIKSTTPVASPANQAFGKGLKEPDNQNDADSNSSPDKAIARSQPAAPATISKAAGGSAKIADKVSRRESQSEPVPEPEITLELIRNRWEAILTELRALKPMLAAFLGEGSPAGFKKKTLTIHFGLDHEFQVEQLKKENRIIKQALEKVVGPGITVRAITTEAFKPGAAKMDEVWNHPVAQHVLSLFDGEIIKD